jgi:Zn-dependent oligopeptidase
VDGRCYDRATIDGMATHYQTGEKIPQQLWEKVAI